MAEKKLSRHHAAETHPSGERVVLFHGESKDSIVLNPTGTWLWNHLETPKSQTQLVEALQQEFPEVDPTVLSEDLSTYIKELTEHSLIVATA